MAKRRAGRRKLDRFGVKVLRMAVFARGESAKAGNKPIAWRHVARWVNPVSMKREQMGLDELGLSNDQAREKWARAKARDLAKTRAAVTSGDAVLGLVSIEQAVEDWLATIEHEPTKASYKMNVERFVGWATARGLVNVQDIVPALLAQYAVDYAAGAAFAPVTGGKRGKKGATKRRRAPSTVALAMRVTRQFLQAARKLGLAPRLTSDAIKERLESPKVPPKPIRFLRPAELRQLLEAAVRHDRDEPDNPRHKAGPIAPLVLAVLLSGCRFDEIANLEWKEVDLQAGEIRLPALRTKTREARTVRLDVSPSLLRLLAAMRLRSPGAELVFGMERGRAEFTRRRLTSEFGAPAFTWHDLRRSAGTILTNAPAIYGAASAWAAAKRAGHSVVIAERSYAGVLHDLPTDAKTIEQAAGIETVCNVIVQMAGGGETAASATSSATG